MIRKNTGILVIAVALSSFSTQAAEVSLGGGSGWHNRIYIAAGVIAAIIAAGIALKFYGNKRPAGNQLGSGSAKTSTPDSLAKSAASSEDVSADKFVTQQAFNSALAQKDRELKKYIDGGVGAKLQQLSDTQKASTETLATLQAQLTTQQGSIYEMLGNVTFLKSQLQQIREERAKASAAVSATVQTQPTSSITPEQFEELSGQVSSLMSQLQTLRADVDNKLTDDDLKPINARMGNMATAVVLAEETGKLQARIDSIDATLKKHAAIGDRLSALKTDLEAQMAVYAAHNTVGASALKELEALRKRLETSEVEIVNLGKRIAQESIARDRLSTKFSEELQEQIRKTHAELSKSKSQDTEKHVRFPSGLVSPKSSATEGGESATEEPVSLAVPPLVNPHAESVSA